MQRGRQVSHRKSVRVHVEIRQNTRLAVPRRAVAAIAVRCQKRTDGARQNATARINASPVGLNHPDRGGGSVVEDPAQGPGVEVDAAPAAIPSRVAGFEWIGVSVGVPQLARPPAAQLDGTPPQAPGAVLFRAGWQRFELVDAAVGHEREKKTTVLDYIAPDEAPLFDNLIVHGFGRAVGA